MKYRKRIIDEMLEEKLEAQGAVLIEGPKWSGKTTSALQRAASILRMDEPDKRENNINMAALCIIIGITVGWSVTWWSI